LAKNQELEREKIEFWFSYERSEVSKIFDLNYYLLLENNAFGSACFKARD
jgi:hypothetical protein